MQWEWFFLGLAILSLILLVNLSGYFLCHRKDPTANQMRRMDKGINGIQQDMDILKNNLGELPKITKLLKEIEKELKK